MAQQVLRKVTGNRLILYYISAVVTVIMALIIRECLR